MLRGGRWRPAALAASVLAAMAMAAAVAGRSCRVDDDGPGGAVRAFVAAAEAGDQEAIYELLGPKTRERLDQAARRATDLGGATQRFSPLDMISIRPIADAPGDIHVIEHDDDRARVRLGDATLDLVRIDTHWRIELGSRSYRQTPRNRTRNTQ